MSCLQVLIITLQMAVKSQGQVSALLDLEERQTCISTGPGQSCCGRTIEAAAACGWYLAV